MEPKYKISTKSKRGMQTLQYGLKTCSLAEKEKQSL